jgi:hypothetical protein
LPHSTGSLFIGLEADRIRGSRRSDMRLANAEGASQ